MAFIPMPLFAGGALKKDLHLFWRHPSVGYRAHGFAAICTSIPRQVVDV